MAIDYSTDVNFATFIDWSTTTTATNDMVGSNNLVTNNGATTIDTGNQYIDYDGINDRLDFPDIDFIAPYSLSILVNMDVNTADVDLFSKYASTNDRLFVFISNTEFDFRTFTAVGGVSTDLTTVNARNTATWYTLTITDDGVNRTQYINAVADPAAGTGRGSSSNAAELVFGGNKFLGGRYMNGKQAQFYYFNKLLTGTEVTAHHNSVIGNRGFNPFAGPSGYSNKVNGVTPSKVNGVAVADISKVNGI